MDFTRLHGVSPPHVVQIFYRWLSSCSALVVWLLLGIGSLWACGALWFDFPMVGLRPWIAGLFGCAAVLICSFLRPRWRAKLVLAGLIMLTMVWWFTLQPLQFRDWEMEVAKTACAEIEGTIVTIYNVRNFQYQTDSKFTPFYETRRLDLNNLKHADVFINYWGSPFMAHPIVSYDFGDDGHICFSIETRPERGEVYSAIGGLYRQYELTYVVADERDVVRVRTNFRKNEEVYLYRLKAPFIRASFIEYLHTINELNQTPRWYNAITNNCTTAIRHQRAASERAPWDYRMLINGYADELLYERKGITTSLPFTELKQISLINIKANAANDSAYFSDKIREGLPGMEP